MDKKLRIFFWIGILFILVGIVLLFLPIGLDFQWRVPARDDSMPFTNAYHISEYGTWKQIRTGAAIEIHDLSTHLSFPCLILGVVVGILLGKRTKATVPRSQRQ